MEAHAGEVIEVHYIDLDVPKIWNGYPGSSITDEFFYLEDGDHRWIVYWNKEQDGKRSAVKLIKDKNGNKLYENGKISFDHDKVSGPRETPLTDISKIREGK